MTHAAECHANAMCAVVLVHHLESTRESKSRQSLLRYTVDTEVLKWQRKKKKQIDLPGLTEYRVKVWQKVAEVLFIDTVLPSWGSYRSVRSYSLSCVLRFSVHVIRKLPPLELPWDSVYLTLVTSSSEALAFSLTGHSFWFLSYATFLSSVQVPLFSFACGTGDRAQGLACPR